MTERTYGMADYTLEEIESSDAYEEFSSSTVKALATHIRELQAELAELKLQHIASVSHAIELLAENAKLKAEQRRFGMRVAEAVRREVQAPNYGSITSLQAIVEQELNRAS